MFTHSVHGVECGREVRAAWRALFLPDSEGAGVGAFGPFFNGDIRTSPFSADVLKKCALITLHSIAEGRGGENGCRSGGRMGCPKSRMWESDGEAWSEDENVSSSGSREGKVCDKALHVIGLQASWQDPSFLEGLGAGKGGIELPHGPGHAVPGNA